MGRNGKRPWDSLLGEEDAPKRCLARTGGAIAPMNTASPVHFSLPSLILGQGCLILGKVLINLGCIGDDAGATQPQPPKCSFGAERGKVLL